MDNQIFQGNYFKRLIEKITIDNYQIGKYKLKKEWVWLGLILFVATILRVVNNNTSFFSFWIDEADYALRSIYILEHNGQYNPAFFFDHPPLFMYIQSCFFLAFGKEWYVARGLAVALGVVNVYLFYLIGMEMKDKRLGLILAMLFAVEPVLVMINRQALLENLLGVLLSASFLSVVKYENSQKPHWFLLGAFLFSAALLTKFTAVLFILPLIVYVIIRRVYRKPVFICSVLISTIIVLPVIYLMLPQGFLQFHLYKTQDVCGGYVIGNYMIELGNFAAIIMTLVWLNVGIVPFLLYLRAKLRPIGFNLTRLKEWIIRSPLNSFLTIWGAVSLIGFSFLTFMTTQYIYTILLPIVILLGAVLYLRPTWLKVTIVLFLVFSVATIFSASLGASNQTVNYLKTHLENDDVVIASDRATFAYYFPQNDVYDVTVDNLIHLNATYLVLKKSTYNQLQENNTVAEYISRNYVQVFNTDVGGYQVNYIVFNRQP